MSSEIARSTTVPAPLAGRVALVTGVSRRRGIGAALVARLLADGARVLASGWEPHDAEMPWGADPGGAAALLESLGGVGPRLRYLAADLERAEAAGELIDAAFERFGSLDIVVANHGRSSQQRFDEVTAEELDRCWAANARSCVLLARRLAERRPPGPGGRLITFTSAQHKGPMPREIAYAVSKGAVHQMTASLADAVVDRGITVNCINPGPIDTGYATGRTHERIAAMFPAGRWGQPEDVARLVAWLASDEAAWITGIVIDHEGGFRRWARVRLDAERSTG
jgi:NAD(P)-dependent dehydrogenase (short-subunit alcohol dehydrogenase family)